MDMVTHADDTLLETRRWSGVAVDTSQQGTVRLLNAGLDERDGEIIAHGWLDLESMNLLRVDDYQREVLSFNGGKKGSIREAVEEGIRLPDIMLGMRGQRVTFPKGSSICVLLDRVFIIDGLQRVFALKNHAERFPEQAKNLRIGAEVRFGTDKESERDLFINLNTRRTPVSPNVILRDIRDKHPGILTLYGLSHTDKDFALYERVSWNQRMSRQELITAMMFAKTAAALHTTSGGRGERTGEVGIQLDKLSKNIGLAKFRKNMVEFFDIMDACWGIRAIEYNQSAAHLRGNFLITLAKMFCAHSNFWKGDDLFVDSVLKRKLRTFPVLDPEISRLCSAGSMAVQILQGYLVDHMNKGKRNNRLRKREADDV
jgi:hypothetical protein